jgi:hypothetical protein
MVNQDPIGRLIRDLLDTARAATPVEVRRIVDHVATAPFDQRVLSAPAELRGVTYLGRTLAPRDDALVIHLVTRVFKDEQWVPGTTADEYQEDLRRAVRSPSARLGLYARRGGHLAATVSQLHEAVPMQRRGPKSLPIVLVVYSLERGAIITGYQCSRLDAVSIPPETRWLK